LADAQAAMRRVNPAVIPRNHRIEAAIAAAVAGDRAPFDALLAALATPFDGGGTFRLPPGPDQVVRLTFCGT
ncbi:MAG: hypothetical protein ACK4OP_08950, partial [Gemmobacter sp.]